MTLKRMLPVSACLKGPSEISGPRREGGGGPSIQMLKMSLSDPVIIIPRVLMEENHSHQ
ncbi:hypothetical protein D4764_14G0001550 [Takifugu flavidus]|uniref:Uncharacterized protein n=1 Tax=Takifugu flavidus TaxID=433684 RepID=A0A5C6P2Z6_9TELE|nr:hypothetical protein D4764_14G0001550 [Takifugu flavidus]